MIDIQLTGFDMLSKLGQGGMATVWKACQISLNRTVAIKILSSKFASDAGDIQRFQQEAQSAAKLKHPGIVQVYDANIENGLYFFVMEFVDGYTCADWQIRKGHLDERDILLVADCVADALGYAWERERMIHCDIKPDNIMIDEDGTVKVTDLGLSRTISSMSLEESDEIMGTPAYMAPEQALGEAGLDCRTDMYSLGAMMYHLSTGKLLFEDSPEEEVMERQVNDFAKNPRDLNPSLSKGFCRLVEVLMAKEQSGRPADWSEVRSAIARVKKGLVPKLKLPEGQASTVMKSVLDDEIASNMHAVSARASSHTGDEKPQNRLPVIIIAVVLLLCVAVVAWMIKGGGEKRRVPLNNAGGGQSEDSVSQLPGESQSDMQARKLYYSASSWEKNNPALLDESISRYREVVQSASGTKYAERAEKDISRLESARQEQGIQKVLDSLRTRTDADIGANRYAEAISAYEKYDGEFADETGSERLARAQELKQLHVRWVEREKQRLEEERRQGFDRLLNQIAEHSLKGNFKEAATLAKGAVSSNEYKEFDNSLQELVTMMDSACEIDYRIMETFIQQQGKIVNVDLATGQKQVLINDVRDGKVFASSVIKIRGATASVPANFSIQDISMTERLRRMGDDYMPHVALVKGVMAYSSKSFDHARRLFSATHELLAPRLLKLMEAGQKSVKSELMKERAGLMLRQSGIDTGSAYDKDGWIRSIRSAELSNQALDKLRQNALSFQKANESDDLYSEVSDVISAILSLQTKREEIVQAPRANLPQVRLPDDIAALAGRPEAVIDRLLADNPSLGSEHISLRRNDDGGVVGVRIRSSDLSDISALAAFRDLRMFEVRSDHWRSRAPLSDISALAGLPLEYVMIDGAKLASLEPLKDLPIKELRVPRTEIRDIVPLRGMKLEVVDFSDTKVFDFSVLASMPVKSFAASRSQVKHLVFMRDWQLESLELSDTAVYDFSVATRMPLKRLLAANTQLKILEPFNDCPLEELDISGTGIRDISALKNHSETLRILSMDRVPVRNFDVFRQLDLDGISLEGAGFSDVGIISHMKPKSLNFNETPLKSLDGVDASELKVLKIEKTGIGSINCLKDSPVKRLYCRESNVRNFMPIYESGITHLYVDDADSKTSVFLKLPQLESVNGKWWGGK